MVELYPPQKAAVAKLAAALRELNAVGNWSRTGTGKTVMTLAVAKELGLRPLVCAPLAAHGAWEAWSAELGVPLEGVVNPEKLKGGKTPWVSAAGSGKATTFRWNLDRTRCMVIVDECHRGLSGQKTAMGNMVAMLKPQGIKTALCSATPFSSPLQMKTSGYLLGLHQFSASSFFRFCREHGARNSPWHRGLDFNPESSANRRHLQRIREKLHDRTVCLTVDDLSEYFSDNVVEPTLISLAERDRAEAKAIYAQMEEAVRKKNDNPLVEMGRARQRVELLAVPALADMVEDALAEGLSVYVAQGFKESVRRLEDCLRAKGVGDLAVLTGDTKPADRKESERAFQNDEKRVFLATVDAGGMSISLHQLRPEQRQRTSIVRPTFKADALQQCLGRIHRAGGKMPHPVVQRIVLCSGTIEDRVYRRLMAKSKNIAALTDSDLE